MAGKFEVTQLNEYEMKEETIHISQPQDTKIIPSRASDVRTKMECRLQKYSL